MLMPEPRALCTYLPGAKGLTRSPWKSHQDFPPRPTLDRTSQTGSGLAPGLDGARVLLGRGVGVCCGSTVAPRAAAPQDTRLTRSAVWLRAGGPCLECRGPVEMAHQSSATGRHLPGSEAELARGRRAGREAAHVRTDGWSPRGSARRGTGRSPGHLASNPPGTAGRWALWPLTAQGFEKLGTTLQGFGHKVPRGGCTRPPGSLEQELDLARPFETPAAHNPKARLLHRRPE